MAKKKIDIESTGPWEKLVAYFGVFFGFFAVAKDVPDILRILAIPKLVPRSFKMVLLRLNENSDFWLLIFFGIASVFLLLWLIPRRKEIEEKENEDIIRAVTKKFRRKQIVRIIRSLGLVFLRELFLSLLHVELYGTFKRPPPPDWPINPDSLRSIDRISFTDGKGIEFQYSTDFSNLLIREHSKENNQFGDFIKRRPSWTDVKLLMIASNIFPFWFFVYLIKRPLTWLRLFSCGSGKMP